MLHQSTDACRSLSDSLESYIIREDVQRRGAQTATAPPNPSLGEKGWGPPRPLFLGLSTLSKRMPLVCMHTPPSPVSSGALGSRTPVHAVGFVDRRAAAFELFGR